MKIFLIFKLMLTKTPASPTVLSALVTQKPCAVITSSSVTTAAVTRKRRWEVIVVIARHSAMLKWPAPSIKMKYHVHTDLLYWFLSGRRKVGGDRLYSCGHQC